ncbi:Glyceraldehyde-3-phosphate dehydrogenase 1 [Penicillium daleae]|uniref:glyceraldehyde-3-phosphate dehydrogenase (phosphorylating) n=1 Tax=Penicillium daleae TaxID=63821 RepID=A0AAD6G414_9EURO|nr:Glyceraldehyde-3-phosphate dehydrogenase 1 [Penicillium daleae]KAJ5453714.1 Glyceraldehyde-3-phosphate dehydrogenase 1 [Penicillium daleae]
MAPSINDVPISQSVSTLACQVGINGFGHIDLHKSYFLSYNVLRAALVRSDIQVVTMNPTCVTAREVVYLIRYVLAAPGVDYVLECTGKFAKRDLAMDHFTYGQAKRVLISASSSDWPTFVYGVNSDSYTSREECRVVSNASCTTNCVTPVFKVLKQVLDGYSKKNRRRGVFNNIIPTTTRAAKAVAAVLPDMKGKVAGVSIRAPTPNVSMIDLTISTEKPTSLSEILSAFRVAAKSDIAGVLRVTDEELESADYNGSPYSAIVDAPACTELNP